MELGLVVAAMAAASPSPPPSPPRCVVVWDAESDTGFSAVAGYTRDEKIGTLMQFTVICALEIPSEPILAGAPEEQVLAQSTRHTYWRDVADTAPGSTPVDGLLALFDRAEVILPPVPLGHTAKAFYVINEGYDNLQIKSKLPVDTARAPLQLPEGNLVGISKQKLLMTVSFAAKKPMSFTAKVELNEPCTLGDTVIGYGCPTPSPSVTFAPTPEPKPTSEDESCPLEVIAAVDSCGSADSEDLCHQHTR